MNNFFDRFRPVLFGCGTNAPNRIVRNHWEKEMHTFDLASYLSVTRHYLLGTLEKRFPCGVKLGQH
jgi:hypothetical protein